MIVAVDVEPVGPGREPACRVAYCDCAEHRPGQERGGKHKQVDSQARPPTNGGGRTRCRIEMVQAVLIWNHGSWNGPKHRVDQSARAGLFRGVAQGAHRPAVRWFDRREVPDRPGAATT